MRGGLVLAALIALLSPATAADNGCDKFAWPLTQISGAATETITVAIAARK